MRAPRPSTTGAGASRRARSTGCSSWRTRAPPPCSRPTTASRASGDRKSTRLNSSHSSISYAVFCLKKKTNWQLIVLRHRLVIADVPVPCNQVHQYQLVAPSLQYRLALVDGQTTNLVGDDVGASLQQ